MRNLLAVLVTCAPSLCFASAPGAADPELPPSLTAAAPTSPAERATYVAPELGAMGFEGAAGPAAGIELGTALGSSHVGLHVAATTAAVTTGLFGADGSAGAVRGGPELHTCGGRACLYAGVDVGYAWVHVSGNGSFLSEDGFAHSGTTVAPHVAFELGRSALRLRLAVDGYAGDVSGFDSSIGAAIHW